MKGTVTLGDGSRRRTATRAPRAGGKPALGDLVRLTLKRPFSDGTVALDLDPLSLLVRWAMSVPPPRLNSVRYADVLAAHSKWPAHVVPPPPADEHDGDGGVAAANARPPTHRCGYRPWRELLKRTFRIDVEQCDRCGARLKLRALLLTSAGIERHLRWLGEPSEPPPLAPSRGPPFFESPVIRRCLGEPVPAELFDAQ